MGNLILRQTQVPKPLTGAIDGDSALSRLGLGFERFSLNANAFLDERSLASRDLN